MDGNTNNTGVDQNSTADFPNDEQITLCSNTPKDGSPRHIITHPGGIDARKSIHTTASTKELKEAEVLDEIMSEGFYKFLLPGALLGIAGTFLMRRRFRQMKTTSLENFGLAALHYYGATSVGMLLGMYLFLPTFDKRISERIPYSDLALAKENKRQ